MNLKPLSSIVFWSLILNIFTLTISLSSYANYDELPGLNTISSAAIYKLQFGSTTPPQDQADYNITDQNLIAQIYSGLTKKTQSLFDRHQFLAEGIIYLKLNDNSFKKLIVIDDWKYLYVSSESSSNSIYYEISSDVKTLIIENIH